MYRRSKIIKLLINGNNQFTGKIISVTNNRFSNFNVFLDELTAYFKKMIPNGVRRVYKYGSFQMITRVEDLENYGSYICCGNERLKKIHYDSNFMENNNPNRLERNAIRPPPNHRQPDRITNGNQRGFLESDERYAPAEEKSKQFKCPKPVRIVFSDKPKDVIKIFINRNLEISLHQCLNNIAAAINRKIHKHEKIKIFTVSGREITNINDFYHNRSPLLAFTNPTIMYPSEVREMIHNLFPHQQRAERYFTKWLMDGDSELSSHSIPFKTSSSSTSQSDHSKTKISMEENHSPKENILSYRENKYLNKLSARYSEIEKSEGEKVKSQYPRSNLQTRHNKFRTQTPEDTHDAVVKLALVDKCIQVSPIVRHWDKVSQISFNVKHFDKINQVVSQIGYNHKMTQISFNPRNLDKVTQAISSTKYFDKLTSVYPNLTNSSTATLGDLCTYQDDKCVQCSMEIQNPSKLSPHVRNSPIEPNPERKYFFLSENYELFDVLLESNQSTIYVVEDRNKDKKIIKRINRLQSDINREQEAKILLRCNHEHIVKCFEVFQNQSFLEIVLEYMNEGSLDNYLSIQMMKEIDTKLMIRSVARGLFYLHSIGFVHRDIAPKNIYYRRNPMEFKLGGFSLTKRYFNDYVNCEDLSETVYSAPEVSMESGCNEKMDIWSLGVILCNIVCGKYLTTKSERKFIFENDNPNWTNWSPDCLSLVTEMLQEEPTVRVSALDVVCHPWLTQLDDVRNVRELLTQEMKNYGRDYNENFNQLN